MKLLISTIAALCFAGIASAATVTVTWTNPTTNTDSSAIPATGTGSLTTARIEYGTCNGSAFGTKAGEVSRSMPATSATLNLQPGTTCVRVFVANTYGKESDASNVASRVVDAPTPNPPVLAVIAPTAYDLAIDEQRLAVIRGVAVGRATLGAACDEGRCLVSNYCAVARPSRVSLYRGVAERPSTILAKCG